MGIQNDHRHRGRAYWLLVRDEMLERNARWLCWDSSSPGLGSLSMTEAKQILAEAGGTIETVYLPTGAIVSLVVDLSSGATVEAAMVGRNGVIGAASALDGKLSLSRAMVQLAGEGLACKVGALRQVALHSRTLLSAFVRHEQLMFAQAQQSTACMAAHHVDARLCRWLLQAREWSGSDTLELTQEFMGQMLGVQRSSVTLSALALQKLGLINTSRGKIEIVDVEGLLKKSCECYGAIQDNYKLLLKA